MSLTFDKVSLALPHFDLGLDVDEALPRIALFGPSGAGKTTAVEMLAGVRRPDRGRIVADGRVLCDVQAGVDVPIADRRVGYVTQDDTLFPHLRVDANIAYGRREEHRAVDVEHLVEVFEIRSLLRQRVAKLSGGERRRVAVVRALVSSPRLLILDEPFAGLDDALRGRVIEFLAEWRNAAGVTSVVVTHDRDEARALADVLIVLDRGKVVDVRR